MSFCAGHGIAYTVFNVAQIEGLPAHYYAEPEAAGEMQLLETAEKFFAGTGAVIRHGGNMAYYAPGPDVIRLPVPEAFPDAESYAATKAHELTHGTKPPGRLDRDFGGKRFGNTGDAGEELVAELGSAPLTSSTAFGAPGSDPAASGRRRGGRAVRRAVHLDAAVVQCLRRRSRDRSVLLHVRAL